MHVLHILRSKVAALDKSSHQHLCKDSKRQSSRQIYLQGDIIEQFKTGNETTYNSTITTRCVIKNGIGPTYLINKKEPKNKQSTKTYLIRDLINFNHPAP